MEARIKDGIYYEDGVPKHRGIVKIDGDIYYAGHDGVLAVGYKVVHSSMTNELVRHGTYKFADDGKLIKDSYIAPKRSKSSKKKKKDKKKKQKITFGILIAAAAVAVVAVITLGMIEAFRSGVEGADTKPDMAVVLPAFDEDVYLCTKPMERYYKGEYSFTEAVNSELGAYAPFTFEYKIPDGVTATLELDGQTYELDPSSSVLKVDNLMTGETYPYKVTITDNEETDVRKGFFTTADTNRFIYLPGVQNTRDIGGYVTVSGKRVREGLLIRGTEIDGLVESKYFLTDKSAAEPFGFRCDLDLREAMLFTGSYKSRLGDNVNHKFYTSPSYGAIFSKEYQNALREIFRDFSDPDNYPMYLHCTYGADRTGTVVFLLQGVLGVSEEDMRFEYSLTAFMSSGYKDASNLNGIYGGFEGTNGDTIQDKIVNYLVGEVGVTNEQIESIRTIFLED